MDTLYTFWDNIIHYKTKSVRFLGLMNSATKSKGGMKVGRIEDPLHKDSSLGVSHLPSPQLWRPPRNASGV